ncbi:protein kinase [Pseudomonadota bacterium]
MFAKVLEQYSQGKVTYEEIKEALSSTLTSSPELYTDVTFLLNSDHAKGLLSADQQQELLGIIYEVTQSGGDDGKTVFADVTRIAGQPAAAPKANANNDGDKTQFAETTVFANSPNADATIVSNAPRSDTTIIGGKAAPSPINTDAPTPTTPPVQQPARRNSGTPHIGDTIKGRFVLEDLLGQGGMGSVYKAVDLRKKEAEDSNPFVAIKILSGAFKHHPQALISLQRESRKAQTLAHPNIVTVFDFDRDDDVVYMTMEYLEGKPLDKLIKESYPAPFEKEQALHIIDGISNGLAYAHSHNIIHSDLKPGNIYVTKNNTVKVLDFGIARAVKSKDGEQDDDHFDAGDLGALTPAYASYEMLKGEDPDERDDIYALACIAHEMLAGSHPFNKEPADKAKEKKATPAAVANLSRRQSKGLTKGLSFERTLRTPTVVNFQDDLCGKRKLSNAVIGAIGGLSILTTAVASIPVMNYLDDQKIGRLVNKLNSGDEQIFLASLGTMSTLDGRVREDSLDGAKDAIIKYYERRVEEETDTDNGKFNFGIATRLLEEARNFYPDSAQLESVIARINNRKNTLLNDITNRFNQHIDEENLISKPRGDDLMDALAEAALIDNDHPLLSDPRISIAYSQAAQKAAQANNLGYAGQLIDTGLALLPADISLINMLDAIEAAKTDTGGSASQLAQLQRSLEKSVPPAQRKQTIEDMLKKPFNNRQWSKTLELQFTYLKEAVGAGDPWIDKYNPIIRDIYLKETQKMRKAERYSVASSLIRTVKAMVPSTSSIIAEENRIVAAKKVYEQDQKKKAEVARIAGAKQTLLTQTNANDVKGAKASFKKLRAALPASDSFISRDAPKAIAGAYMRLAESSANRGDYTSAVALAKAGLEMTPSSIPMQNALASYQAKVKTPARGAATTATTTAAPTDPCKANYAGHGTRSRATCSDMLSNQSKSAKGPTMIVVPGSASMGNAFAISKYEITVADYNLYCKLSNNCSAQPGDAELPVTTVSITDAKQYAEWLGKTTGYSYRIPSEAEWLYAAKAGGKQPQKDFNCKVSLGGNVLKGQALLSARSGKANGWGLTNYIGNAQEWVLADQSLNARGGAYKDPLSSCDISLSRKHSGAPDNITGFRLVRELKAGS